MNKWIVMKIKEYVNAPEIMRPYGKWGVLNIRQRKLIRDLCDSWIVLDNATNYQMEEIERLNNIINKVIADIEDVRDKNNYYEDYKVDNSILTYWIDILKGSDKE